MQDKYATNSARMHYIVNMGRNALHILIFLENIILGAWLIQSTTFFIDARPPRNPVQCSSSGGLITSCTVSNAYGIWPDRLPCTAANVVYPTSEAELLIAVAAAVEKKQKMKVVSKYAHSIPKLVCPGGSHGLLISTQNYTSDIVIDVHNMTVVVDSGVELRQLLDALAEAGLALLHSPFWEGVSIGGLLSTGTHGSSFFGKGSAVHEYVKGMRLVVPATQEEGYAKITEISEGVDDETLSAAKVSLGVLGAISKVTFQVQPLFKRSITYQKIDDDDLEERILTFSESYEFGELMWHPALQSVVYRLDDRVPVDVVGDGIYDFFGFRPFDVVVLEEARILETTSESTSDAEAKCATSLLQVSILQALGYGLTSNATGSFQGYPVIGYQHQMQSSGSCLYTPQSDLRVCPWDSHVNGEFFYQTTVSISVSQIKGFIKDVKALRDIAMQGREGLCGLDLYYGVFTRFVKNSSALLGKPEDAVDMDFTYYRARGPGEPRLLEDVMEEVEQMAVFKYGGLPHWGKNRAVAFWGVADKYPDMHRFLAVKERLDPDALFSSEWSDFVLGLTPTPQPASLYSAAGCALEGLCICSSDAHCAPNLGYLCRPGRVYQAARVCRKASIL